MHIIPVFVICVERISHQIGSKKLIEQNHLTDKANMRYFASDVDAATSAAGAVPKAIYGCDKLYKDNTKMRSKPGL